MYAWVGVFLVSWNISTVPLTWFSHNSVFSRNQNAHGNWCTSRIHKRLCYRRFLLVWFQLAHRVVGSGINSKFWKQNNWFKYNQLLCTQRIGLSKQTCSVALMLRCTLTFEFHIERVPAFLLFPKYTKSGFLPAGFETRFSGWESSVLAITAWPHLF